MVMKRYHRKENRIAPKELYNTHELCISSNRWMVGGKLTFILNFSKVFFLFRRRALSEFKGTPHLEMDWIIKRKTFTFDVGGLSVASIHPVR